jgi:membrane fusion protein (multidrug efflux system)
MLYYNATLKIERGLSKTRCSYIDPIKATNRRLAMSRRSIIFLTLLVSLAMLVICFWTVKSKLSHKARPQRGKPAVVIEKVTQSNWQATLTATGSISAVQGTVIKAQSAGVIEKIYVKSGQAVKAGEVLLSLENGIQKGELDYEKAQLHLSKLNYDRYKSLLKTGAAARKDYDQNLYTYQSNLAQVEKAKTQFDQTIIRAPFAGQVGVTHLSIGQYLSVGSEILNLQQLDPLNVDFTVPEQNINRIKVGESVKIKSNAYPNKVFYGKVSAIDAAIDPDSGTLAVQARFPNSLKDFHLLPGNFVTVILEYGAPKEIISVPQTAINYSNDGNYVFRIQGGKAEKTLVKLGGQYKQNIIINSGLKRSDVIVTIGGAKLHNGSSIRSVAG